MRPVYITYALAAAADNNIAASQTPGAAGNLTLVSSPVVLDTTRRVLLTFVGNETGHTFVVYGTNAVTNGSAIQETVAGTTAGTVSTTQDFGTVTRVSISAAATNAIRVGTSGVGSTPWQMVNYHAQPVNQTVAVAVTGTVNYTLQYTYSDLMGTPNPSSWTTTWTAPVAWNDPVLAGVTASGETTWNDPITGWRVQINSGTGSLAITGIQAGIRG